MDSQKHPQDVSEFERFMAKKPLSDDRSDTASGQCKLKQPLFADPPVALTCQIFVDSKNDKDCRIQKQEKKDKNVPNHTSNYIENRFRSVFL